MLQVAGGLQAREEYVLLRDSVGEQGAGLEVLNGVLQEIWSELTATQNKSLRTSKPSPKTLNVREEWV